MKSISKPNSLIPEEEPCVLKMLGNHFFKYKKVYWRAHTKAQRSWAKSLADSPALHFKQRQSHPAAVIWLQPPPLWKHLLPFLLDMCHFHHHVLAAAITDCQSTRVAGLPGIHGFSGLGREQPALLPSSTSASPWGYPPPRDCSLGPAQAGPSTASPPDWTSPSSAGYENGW